MALDLSLAKTGVATTAGVTLIQPKARRGPERLVYVQHEVIRIAEEQDIDLVAIEGYSYGSRYGGERLGELGGVIRVGLYSAGIDYIEVAPHSIKKYATGKGNAPKDAVLVEAVRRLGYDGAQGPDGADALWLWALVREAAGEPVVTVPAKHREALGTIDLTGGVNGEC
jgi:crossover junction endodeoxyribonuclease RuvC